MPAPFVSIFRIRAAALIQIIPLNVRRERDRACGQKQILATCRALGPLCPGRGHTVEQCSPLAQWDIAGAADASVVHCAFGWIACHGAGAAGRG
jgi:hypothetical protein